MLSFVILDGPGMMTERALGCLLLCCLAHVATATIYSCPMGQGSGACACTGGDPAVCGIVAVLLRINDAFTCQTQLLGKWAWVGNFNDRAYFFRCASTANFRTDSSCAPANKFHLYWTALIG
jgi:hypothetical protein